MKRLIIPVIIFCLFAFQLTAQKVYSDYVDGKIYFKLKLDQEITFTVNEVDKTVSISDFPYLDEVKDEFGIMKITRPLSLFNNPKLLRSIYIDFDSIYKVDEFEKYLQNLDCIDVVEKIAIIKSMWQPNDSLFDTFHSQYKINLKWYLDLIKAEKAWDIKRGSTNIKVAIIDNAVWGEHPDLQIPREYQCNATKDPVEIGNSAPPIDVVDQYSECDLSSIYAKVCQPYEWSHGTHCAGLAAALLNNGTGSASIGGGVSLMSVRCTESGREELNSAAILRGVQWAAENGANVISMSYGSEKYTSSANDVYQACLENGVILVAAAGNNSTSTKFYPAAYDGIISVASVNSNKKLSGFSNYGDWVKVAAPGGSDVSLTAGGEVLYRSMFSTTFSKSVIAADKLSFLKGQYYDCMQGTSMACPVVSGLCGLILSQNPKLTATEMEELLQTNAQELVPYSGRELNSKAKVIDAYEAMKIAASTVPNALFTASRTLIEKGEDIEFSDTSFGANSTFFNSKYNSTIASRKWYFPGGSIENSTESPVTVTYNNPGIYSVILVVEDSRGVKDSIVKENYINVAVPLDEKILTTNVAKCEIAYHNKATASFHVISDLEWDITKTDNWIISVTPSSKDSNRVVDVVLEENTTFAERTSTLVIAEKENPANNCSIVITQKAGLPILTVNKINDTIFRKGGAAEFSVESNVEWQITKDADWVTINTVSGTAGETEIILEATENKTPLKRIARCMISSSANPNITKQVTIEQEKVPTFLVVNPLEIMMDSVIGDSAIVTISSNSNWEFSGIPDWLTVTPSKGEGDTTVKLTITKLNVGNAIREKRITIASGNVEQKILVQQRNNSIGINTLEKGKDIFHIYPNPFNTVVFIENRTDVIIRELAVVDLTGKTVLTKKVIEPSKKIQLDLNGLNQGIYLLKINTSNGKTQYRKLIKN